MFMLGSDKIAVLTGSSDSAWCDRINKHIFIGLDGDWQDVLDRIHHEAFELAFIILDLRYQKSEDPEPAFSSMVFMMNHNEFQRACKMASGFLAEAIPFCLDRWKAYQKRKVL